MINERARLSSLQVLLALCSVGFAADTADLVLLSGKIVTMDESGTIAEALAIKGDRILAVGTNDDVARFVGPATRQIDLHQRLATPGFIEGHGHFVGLGHAQMMLNLRAAAAWDDIVKQVERAVRDAAPGEWIVGRGWHQEKWTQPTMPNVDGYPTHGALSAVSPNNPVLLIHASGHMSFANAKAMERASVDASTKDPQGGQIVRDKTGNPIGIFRETAQALISRSRAASERQRTPEQRHQRTLRAIELATQECVANGITSFQDAGSSLETIDVFKKLADEGKLQVRLWVMVRDSNERLARQLSRYRFIGYGNNFLTVRAIKRSIDGALAPAC